MPWNRPTGFPADGSNNSNRANNEADNGSSQRNGALGPVCGNDATSDLDGGAKDGLAQRSTEHTSPRTVADCGGGTLPVLPLGGHEKLPTVGMDLSAVERARNGKHDLLEGLSLPRPLADSGFQLNGGACVAPQAVFQNEYFMKLLQLQNHLLNPQKASFAEPRVRSGAFASWKPPATEPAFGRKDRSGCGDATANNARTSQSTPKDQGGVGGRLLDCRESTSLQYTMQAKLGMECWERVRLLMLQQQEQFSKQLWELHRVHWFQRYLVSLNERKETLDCEDAAYEEKTKSPKQHSVQQPAQTELQQTQMQYAQALSQFLQDMMNEARGAGALGLSPCRTGGHPVGMGQEIPGLLHKSSTGFPPQNPNTQTPTPGHGASQPPTTMASGLSGVPHTSSSMMQQPAVDPHALWYAKHYGHSGDHPWNPQLQGGGPWDATLGDRCQGQGTSLEGGLEWPAQTPAGSSDPISEGALAAAVKAVAEANPQRWWQNAARAIGNAFIAAPPAPPACTGNEKPSMEGQEHPQCGQRLNSAKGCQHLDQGRWAFPNLMCCLCLSSLFEIWAVWLVSCLLMF